MGVHYLEENRIRRLVSYCESRFGREHTHEVVRNVLKQ